MQNTLVLYGPYTMDSEVSLSPSKITRAVLLVAMLTIIGSLMLPPHKPRSYTPLALTLQNPFNEGFNSPGIVHEVGSPGESSSTTWWVNSGGKLINEKFVGRTIQGDLPLYDTWRLLYSVSNPTDTDKGLHPQNIFRLVSKNVAGNMAVESLFKIEKDNWSASPNRNQSNGILLMSKYVDGNTLYYAGLRVDGKAVIKKKYKGTYYTMATGDVFPGTYSVNGKVNLIPHREWIGLRSENVTNADGSVTVRLLMKRRDETAWKKILEAKDDGKAFGNTPPITQVGSGGIRTDFMDVSFESFKMQAL